MQTGEMGRRHYTLRDSIHLILFILQQLLPTRTRRLVNNRRRRGNVQIVLMCRLLRDMRLLPSRNARRRILLTTNMTTRKFRRNSAPIRLNRSTLNRYIHILTRCRNRFTPTATMRRPINRRKKSRRRRRNVGQALRLARCRHERNSSSPIRPRGRLTSKRVKRATFRRANRSLTTTNNATAKRSRTSTRPRRHATRGNNRSRLSLRKKRRDNRRVRPRKK